MNQEQLQALKTSIEGYEGRTSWLYRDSAVRGNATIGVGHLISSLEDAQSLPFYPAIDLPQWNTLMTSPAGCRASFYKMDTYGRLSDPAIDALLDQDISAVIDDLSQIFPEFSSYPGSVQQALADMRFNLGGAGFRKFGKLIAAVKALDWTTAAKESNRLGISSQRNSATADLFAQAR